jgi:undecaprenyl-diphosphatase
MGSSLIIGGVVMWIVDAMNAKWETAGPAVPGSRIHTWHMEEMSFGQAVWIGVCQIFSGVFPGTSRSMSTITGGQIAGMSRASALEFSFFVSMPVMAAATGYGWIVLAIGFVVSFIVAYGAVAWFMAWVRRHGFVPFAIYRIIAGIAVLLWISKLSG